MDTFENSENSEFREESESSEPVREPAPEEAPASQQESGQSPYHGVGAGRKESPYADSPYVMDHAARQENARGYQPPQYQYQPQTEPPKKPARARKSRRPVWKGILAAALVVVLVVSGCLITAASVNRYWEDRTEATVSQLSSKISALQQQIDNLNRSTGASVSGSPAVSGDGMTPGQVYARCVDSVVAISCSTQVMNYYGQTAQSTSSGSGFILTEDGYVVTNYHVVEGASSISVTTNTGTEYPAAVKGYDSSNDIAVLKVDAEGLPAAAIGSSDDLIVGDMVVAIGNPLGTLTYTQTVGYVSGKDRDVTTDNTIINMIQTDVAINPGNSGGPLFNMKGEVVGITTAKYSGTTTSGASIEGIGFAIPIDDVKGIIRDLADYGYVTGAYLGVTVTDNDAEAAAYYGLPTEGAYVVSVEAGSAAEQAGIRPKDVIVNVGGYDVTSLTSLSRVLRNFKAGDVTTVTVFRGGTELVLDITLGEKPQTTAATAPSEDSSMPSEGSYEEWYKWFFGGDNNG